MTDISKLSQYVVQVLRSTPEYIEYAEKLAELRKNPELFQRVNDLREKNFLLHQNEPENEDELLDLMDALTNEYEDVINIKLVSEFMGAESAFCRLMQEYTDAVTFGMEFD